LVHPEGQVVRDRASASIIRVDPCSSVSNEIRAPGSSFAHNLPEAPVPFRGIFLGPLVLGNE
jgi:hypothetical protein